jgi:hypothetical protein
MNLKCFVVISPDGQTQVKGPFQNNDALRSEFDSVAKTAQIGSQVVFLEQYSKLKIKAPAEEIVADQSEVQTDERDKAPAKEPALPQEVLDYMTSLSQNTDADLRELGNIKGVDGRITNREKLIEALTAIFIQGN